MFALFLVIDLVSLLFINFSPIYSYLNTKSIFIIPVFSTLLVLLIIFAFVYRETVNSKIEDEFITIITHKFKTPLTGIRWSIDMLQKDMTLIEKGDLLMEMRKANERLMEIVDLLIGFSSFDRRLEYNYEETSLKEIVDFSYNKYATLIKNKDIKTSIEVASRIPLIYADKNKIQFVVDMLVDNAIKYTQRGGSINVKFDENKNFVVMTVKDNGIGMGFFDSQKIFSHFFRAKNARNIDAEGLGLGLFTAKKIVDHHKGKIWASSPGINKGTTFHVYLPVKRK